MKYLLYWAAGAAALGAGAVPEQLPLSSLVRVEYHLRHDAGEPPRGALGAERCPNCGRFHQNNLAEHVAGERPVEMAGFLVAPNRVMTADPQLDPRFIQKIVVRQGDASSPASLDGYAQQRPAVWLALANPLATARPLEFASTEKPAVVIRQSRVGGLWTVERAPFPAQVYLPERGTAFLPAPVNGLAVASNGQPVGLVFGGRLPADDSWKGNPTAWPSHARAEVEAQGETLRAAARAQLINVQLSFRSPRKEAQAETRYSFGRDAEDYSATERHALGVALKPDTLLVLANLKPRVTARLERILCRLPDGRQVTAQFVASLKDWGALVARLPEPLPSAARVAEADPAAILEQALWCAEIALKGENRTEHFYLSRITDFKAGYRQQLFPEWNVPGDTVPFLYDWEQRLLTLPLMRRGQLSAGRERFNYESQESLLTPARVLWAAVNALPEGGDPANAPVSAAEENRLAWMGVELQGLKRDLARANNVSSQTRDGEFGALVTFVHADSPAGRAGVAPGWILLSLQVPGQSAPVEIQLEEDYMRAQAFPWDRLDQVTEQYYDRIPTPWPSVENSLTRVLTDLGFGARYTASFFTDGKVATKDLEVAPGPPHYDSAARWKSEVLGLTVRDLTYEVRRYYQRKPEEPGVVVSKIEAGGKASVAGIKPYEVITHVNDQPVNNVKDFEKLAGAPGDLRLSVKRMAQGRIVQIK